MLLVLLHISLVTRNLVLEDRSTDEDLGHLVVGFEVTMQSLSSESMEMVKHITSQKKVSLYWLPTETSYISGM